MSARSMESLIYDAPDGRFAGIRRDYGVDQVVALRGTLSVRYSLAEHAAKRLWHLLNSEDYVHALGAMTGGQAVQMVRAGLKAIYLSGWQVAADANGAGSDLPRSEPLPGRQRAGAGASHQPRAATRRPDRQRRRLRHHGVVRADRGGRGGRLRRAAQRLRDRQGLHRAGVGGIHFEDQLASEKKCGHMGGKVLIPTQAHIRNLSAARLAADVCGTATVIVARTDADSAKLITSDIDERDRPFIAGERTAEGFHRLRDGEGMARCIARGLAFAPYADLLWMETSTPDLAQARSFAEAMHREFPGKMLAYNCSPSFNWRDNIDERTIARFQRELGAMGYKFQFVTLAGFHSLNHGMFELAQGYRDHGMAAYSALQEAEFASESAGYTATRHQHEVGAAYFDAVSMAVSGGAASTAAMTGSTETDQFTHAFSSAAE